MTGNHLVIFCRKSDFLPAIQQVPSVWSHIHLCCVFYSVVVRIPVHWIYKSFWPQNRSTVWARNRIFAHTDSTNGFKLEIVLFENKCVVTMENCDFIKLCLSALKWHRERQIILALSFSIYLCVIFIAEMAPLISFSILHHLLFLLLLFFGLRSLVSPENVYVVRAII